MRNKLMIMVVLFAGMMGVANAAFANSLEIGTSHTQVTGVVAVPVSITGNTNRVSAVTVKIQYDKTKVSVTAADVSLGADTSAVGWNVKASITPPVVGSNTEELQINLFKSPVAFISSATITLVNINFTVLSTAANIPLTLVSSSTVYLGVGNAVAVPPYTNVNGSIVIGAAPAVDTIPPVAPTISTPTTGSSSNNNKPAVSGTAEANSKVRVYDTNGTTLLGTATAAMNGSWTLNSILLADGAHTLTAKATDVAGNTSVVSTGVVITIDTVAPAAPVISQPTTGTLTNITMPKVSGLSEANATVKVYDTNGITLLGTTTASGTRAWTLTSATLAAGAHSFTAKASDAAGNSSTASAAVTYTVDTTAPVVTVPASITVAATSLNGAAITDTLVAAFLNGATAIDNVGVVGAIANDAPVTLPAGTTTVTFTATDAANNAGTGTATITVSAYVAPPITAPIISLNGVNPTTVEAGQIYVDALATVTDNVDPTNAMLAGVSTVNTAAIGSYTVTYKATDVAGNAAIPVIRTVNVVDTTNPVLTLPANVVVSATGIRSTVAIATATATDLFAITITSNAPVDFPIGTTSVTWTATDANGRVSTGIQQVVVNAVSTVPAFTLNNGSTVSLTAPTGETVFQVAGAAAPAIMPAGVNFPLGTLAYSVTSPFAGSVTMALAFSTPLPPIFTLYKIDNTGVVTAMPSSNWTKSSANTIQLTLTDGGAFDLDGLQNGVIVDPIAIGVDTQAPVITLTGANSLTIAQGGTFTDPGTSVSDNVNVGLVATVTGAVDTAKVGTYTLTYHVKDLTGNAAIALTRTVRVTNQSTLVVTAPANITVTATSAAGIANTDAAIASFLSGATATNNVGVVGAITNNAPATLPVGTTTVIFTVVDAAGNTGTATSTVTVNAYIPPDSIKPLLIMIGGNVTVVQGQIYTDVGATASDNVDGNITTSIVVNNLVNASVIGAYTVTYNVSDAAGNNALQLTRTVNVVADQPPLITLIGATPITIVQGAVYNDGSATALDDVDGNVTANIATLNSVNTAVVASYTVTYNVSDAAGNAAIQVIRTVNVIPVGGAANLGEAVQVPLTGSMTSVDVHAVGQSISNFSATAVSGTPPAGVSVPFGVLSYTTTVSAGVISQTVNLTFSGGLPPSFVLYKVDNAGAYSIIPNGTGVDQWTQVDGMTIALTLSDGGQFDLDGVINGIIIDPVAVGIPPAPVKASVPSIPVAVGIPPAPVKASVPSVPVAAAAPASSGGCSISRSAIFDPTMLVLLLFALIGLAKRQH